MADRLRVLIVEDHKDSATTLCTWLTLLGHEARTASTGPQGVELAHNWRPDVLLCDIGLPGLDGWGVARKLRGDPAMAATRLIAVTGYNAEEDRRRSAEAGFERHLAKPLDPAELLPLLSRPA
jgi:CheY-like chemotaxis protein